MLSLWAEQDYQMISQEMMELYVSGVTKVINAYGSAQGAIVDAIRTWVEQKQAAIESSDWWAMDQLGFVELEIMTELTFQDGIAKDLTSILGVNVPNYARSVATTILESQGLPSPYWIAEGAGVVPVAAIVIGGVISVAVVASFLYQLLAAMEDTERYSVYLDTVSSSIAAGIPMDQVSMISEPTKTHTHLEIPLVSQVGEGAEQLLIGGGEALGSMGWIALAGGILGIAFLAFKS